MKLATVLTLIVALSFLLAGCSETPPQAHNDTTENPEALETKPQNSEELAEVPLDEFSVHAVLAFKNGATRTRRTKLERIPNAPPFPDVLEPLDGVYHFSSEAIFSGAIATARVPEGSPAGFKNLRFVRLTSDDLYPSGYAWKDCTVEDPKLGKEYLPNETEHKLSCYFDNAQGTTDYYFMVVRRMAEPRRTPLTSFRFVAETTQRVAGEARVGYLLRVTNTGSEDVGEVNFGSTFESNVKLVDIRPQSGKCQPARYGDSESSVVCYLGELKAGQTTVVELVAEAGFQGKPSDLDKKDFNHRWVIRGFARKTPADMVMPGDVFTFEPLKKG